MLLDELEGIARSLDENAFATRFPDPVLVGLGAAELLEDGVTFATPSAGLEVQRPPGKGRSLFEETWKDVDPKTLLQMLSGDQTSQSLKPIAGGKGGRGSPEVVFVTKTNRNPFLMMVTVGRTGNNDIVLDDITVSKVHAYFVRQAGGGWMLHDQRSTNGTFLGEAKVPIEGLRLAEGSRVAFGNHHAFRFHTARGFHASLGK